MKWLGFLLVMVLLIACDRETVNEPPVAIFVISPDRGIPSTLFEFDASGSTDPEDGPEGIELRWDWNGDGKYETPWSQQKVLTHFFSQTGNIRVQLEVKDSEGLSSVYLDSLFITPDDEGTFTDPRDEQVYHYLTIGTQTWMLDNLAWLPAVNGTDKSSDSEKRYYVFGYEGTDVASAQKTWEYQNYGVLYNWSAAMQGASASSSVPSFIPGACPPGWHLPSDGEWKVLEKNLGMNEDELDKGGWRNSGALAILLKEAGGSWQSAGFEATNASGFSAKPGGSFINWHFFGGGYTASFWSTSLSRNDGTTPYGRDLTSESNGIRRAMWTKSEGFSIRCVRN